MNWKITSLPFTYLGIPIRANPRREETWKPIMDKVQKGCHLVHQQSQGEVIEVLARGLRGCLWGFDGRCRWGQRRCHHWDRQDVCSLHSFWSTSSSIHGVFLNFFSIFLEFKFQNKACWVWELVGSFYICLLCDLFWLRYYAF